MKLQNYVDKEKENMLKSLSEILKIDSVRGDKKVDAPFGEGPKQCLNFILNIALEMGFKTKNVDNYMGWAEYGDGNEMVAVLGHLDVVPAGNGWSKNPFSGDIENGNIHGRGAVDDKGPIIACLYALNAIKNSKLPLKRRIRILFGTNEETGSTDIKYYLDKDGEIPVCGFTPDGEFPLINGEKGIINASFRKTFKQSGKLILKKISGGTAFNVVPADASAEFLCDNELKKEIKKVFISSEKACLKETDFGFTITTKGLEAHASTPEKGENAIGNLLKAIKDLPLDKELSESISFVSESIGIETDGKSLGINLSDDISGNLSLNLGLIEGNSEYMDIKINYRYPVTKSYEDCAPMCDQKFKQAGFEKIFETHKKSLYVDESSDFIKILLGVYEEKTTLKGVPKSIGGGTYAKAIPNVVAFGPIFPGDVIREHLPNEFLEIEKLHLCMDIYAEAMYKLANK